MNAARGAAAIAVLIAAAAMLGCGGGSAEAETQAKVSPTVLADANANCRYLLRETKKLGSGFLRGSSDIQTRATQRLVKPSIPLLERMARRQQALAQRAGNPQFSIYAGLFDPIVVLAQQRLHSGLLAERPGHQDEINRSRELEGQMTALLEEQVQFAHGAGLSACDVNFEQVLLSSLTE